MNNNKGTEAQYQGHQFLRKHSFFKNYFFCYSSAVVSFFSPPTLSPPHPPSHPQSCPLWLCPRVLCPCSLTLAPSPPYLPPPSPPVTVRLFFISVSLVLEIGNASRTLACRPHARAVLISIIPILVRVHFSACAAEASRGSQRTRRGHIDAPLNLTRPARGEGCRQWADFCSGPGRASGVFPNTRV